MATRDLTLKLVEPLSPEDCQVQSMPDASPAKWHLAHTTWFFETFVLKPHGPGYRVFHPEFEFLFNSYYNGIGEQYPRALRGVLTRPSLDEVIAWRGHVDAALAHLGNSDPGPVVAALLELGINHEQQHQELLLTDIKHALSINPLKPAFGDIAAPAPQPAAELRWTRYPGGTARIGHTGSGFAYDNEGPQHDVLLLPFELASRLVTNAEYAGFIADDGYRRPELWLSDGWAAAQAENWTGPLYWHVRDQAQFTLAGMRPIEPSAPVVHLSYYEAEAYARWAGARLPRESEWEVIASRVPVSGNFLDTGWLHPMPAEDADSPHPMQLFGDAWEWTQSAYSAYPGYRPADGAIGEYNGKFMSNQFVLRGGSCITPAGHVRPTYRNFFPPAARWQFSGIRLARDR